MKIYNFLFYNTDIQAFLSSSHYLHNICRGCLIVHRRNKHVNVVGIYLVTIEIYVVGTGYWVLINSL